MMMIILAVLFVSSSCEFTSRTRLLGQSHPSHLVSDSLTTRQQYEVCKILINVVSNDIKKGLRESDTDREELNYKFAEKIHHQCNMDFLSEFQLKGIIEEAFKGETECLDIALTNFVYLSKLKQSSLKTTCPGVFQAVRTACEEFSKLKTEKTHECRFLISGLKEMLKQGSVVEALHTKDIDGAQVIHSIWTECNEKYVSHQDVKKSLQANFDGRNSECLSQMEKVLFEIRQIKSAEATKEKEMEKFKSACEICEKNFKPKREVEEY